MTHLVPGIIQPGDVLAVIDPPLHALEAFSTAGAAEAMFSDLFITASILHASASRRSSATACDVQFICSQIVRRCDRGRAPRPTARSARRATSWAHVRVHRLNDCERRVTLYATSTARCS